MHNDFLKDFQVHIDVKENLSVHDRTSEKSALFVLIKTATILVSA